MHILERAVSPGAGQRSRKSLLGALFSPALRQYVGIVLPARSLLAGLWARRPFSPLLLLGREFRKFRRWEIPASLTLWSKWRHFVSKTNCMEVKRVIWREPQMASTWREPTARGPEGPARRIRRALLIGIGRFTWGHNTERSCAGNHRADSH